MRLNYKVAIRVPLKGNSVYDEIIRSYLVILTNCQNLIDIQTERKFLHLK